MKKIILICISFSIVIAIICIYLLFIKNNKTEDNSITSSTSNNILVYEEDGAMKVVNVDTRPNAKSYTYEIPTTKSVESVIKDN